MWQIRKAHPFIKKVFALSHGTRADYVGDQCIVRRGRAFTTSCLRNFWLGRHLYGSRGDFPHRRRDHIPDIVKEPCWFFQPSVESQLAPGECVLTVLLMKSDVIRGATRQTIQKGVWLFCDPSAGQRIKTVCGSSATGVLVKSSLGTVCGSVVVSLQARTLKQNVWLARCRHCAGNKTFFRKGAWPLFDQVAYMCLN